MENPTDVRTDWEEYTKPIAKRFDREVQVQLGQSNWELPEEITELDFWQACQHDRLGERLSIPFHELRQPKKREHCLDIGCGVSFLIYPWNHWSAYFHGHELSPQTVQFVQSRGPQLNSKLFKQMERGVAHQLSRYDEAQFDLAIATGFLYYYPADYFALMWQQLQRALAPKAVTVVEVVDPESEWIDEWGLVELAKGLEPILTPLQEWEALFVQVGAKVRKQARGELFATYAIAPAA
ncbi:class I SAM-dependent methyltransferase [Synechococcus sp. PCC 7336]|uniref:class I SAM-dependent methyltransferase n=1 Tax=Synechococcus sp. PCC 7336 TaxID=195250 RepID=UPI0003449A70|nr:class I SAM-dependent methyltransferase [Synechococcus sp. PCC 7336]